MPGQEFCNTVNVDNNWKVNFARWTLMITTCTNNLTWKLWFHEKTVYIFKNTMQYYTICGMANAKFQKSKNCRHCISKPLLDSLLKKRREGNRNGSRWLGWGWVLQPQTWIIHLVQSDWLLTVEERTKGGVSEPGTEAQFSTHMDLCLPLSLHHYHFPFNVK